ncbi:MULTISPECIES: YdeI/OmpD-associated family protein [unclassified Nocardioides]|uniref:YdeI/OmpD-associated family protein n=1 Tax=unclassified Nocardioides TaxID=2615069 RepID=UPI003014EB6F
MTDLEELLVPDAAAWRAWLEEHHADVPGVWLVLTKKGGDTTALTRADALDEALCFGWIDGQARSRDAATSYQRMTPRTARSRWSQVNVGLIGRLEAEGRMAPAGRAAVEAAQADGRWAAAYAPPSTAVVPEDLLAAVAANPEAQAMLDVLTSANRFALIHRLGAVKRAETRERKIREFVEMLARHETFYPQKAKPSS